LPGVTALNSRLRTLPGKGLLATLTGALVLRAIAGVGFANYDTLYALAWGGQLTQGETPAYGVPIAPTPHPLLELLGIVLRPFSPRTEIDLTVWLGFAALAACGWIVFRLGQAWFGWAAGALAALVFLTRVPVISYGVRAYLDVPYLTFVLGALLCEARRPRAGRPVLVMLALAGLLRPEAWVFSGLYWLYLLDWLPARVLSWLPAREPGQERPQGRELLWLTLLSAAGPVIWLGSDLIVTGNPLWSLTNTRHTASTLDRKTGIANVPEYVPRRIGEVMGASGLAGAASGGVLALLWLGRKALTGALAGVLALAVFIAFACVGLPIDTRSSPPRSCASSAGLAPSVGCACRQRTDGAGPGRRWAR
jgi:hypothetical protein